LDRRSLSGARPARLAGHVVHRPRPPLDALVEFIWIAEGYVAATPRERILPSGALALVFNLGSPRFHAYDEDASAVPLDLPPAVVCGARARPLVIDTSRALSTMGVHFKPGGARPFVGPADALEDRIVPLDAIWGRAADSLRERVLEASTTDARVALVEEALLRSAESAMELPPALRLSLAAFDEQGLPSVEEVRRRSGLSPKQLIALFRDRVGLGPKAYWRVRRFRGALDQLEAGARNGAGVAADHGYFDQAHWIREFRALAGSSPREYLSARIPGTDHVSLREGALREGALRGGSLRVGALRDGALREGSLREGPLREQKDPIRRRGIALRSPHEA
jgi:AraC-like DNA-binding protein